MLGVEPAGHLLCQSHFASTLLAELMDQTCTESGSEGSIQTANVQLESAFLQTSCPGS